MLVGIAVFDSVNGGDALTKICPVRQRQGHVFNFERERERSFTDHLQFLDPDTVGCIVSTVSKQISTNEKVLD